MKAITFDYWDTLYAGAALPARARSRRQAIGTLLEAYGRRLDEVELADLYHRAGVEADRWWRHEHRGYTTVERIRWMLTQLGVHPAHDCRHLARAVAAVDDVLLELPPPLLPGAGDALRSLAAVVPLAIVSDTGFASGRAQDRVLERDGLRDAFAATIYSMDVGHAKPRGEMFAAAAAALGVAAHEIVHVGDNERTDVGGALAAGFRAVRLDVVRDGGPSAAELVARGFDELLAHFAGELPTPLGATG